MISLAEAKFPVGTRGYQLDVLAAVKRYGIMGSITGTEQDTVWVIVLMFMRALLLSELRPEVKLRYSLNLGC